MPDLPKCWNKPAFPWDRQTQDGGLTIGEYATLKAMEGLLSSAWNNERMPWLAVEKARATLLELERAAE